jgi:hypothetical protein
MSCASFDFLGGEGEGKAFCADDECFCRKLRSISSQKLPVG